MPLLTLSHKESNLEALEIEVIDLVVPPPFTVVFIK